MKILWQVQGGAMGKGVPEFIPEAGERPGKFFPCRGPFPGTGIQQFPGPQSGPDPLAVGFVHLFVWFLAPAVPQIRRARFA